ncbi:MAG: DUF4062 domain-containing protein [Phycisphaeraceae bacterium]
MIHKREVMIASNFDEFESLRSRLRVSINASGLQLQAIDLNLNEPATKSALETSLDAAQRCDLMILLVGERYGGIPTGKQLGYTHLEFRAAAKSRRPILAFFVGPSYRDGSLPARGSDRRLVQWRDEVLDHVVCSFAHPTTEKEECALLEEIIRAIERVVFDMLSEQEQSDLETAADDEVVGVLDPEWASEEELRRLEKQSSGTEIFGLADDYGQLDRTSDLLANPALAAVMEQRREAARAIDLGEPLIAIAHLRRALESRPLDLEATYWLAYLLSKSGLLRDRRTAQGLACRAAAMAAKEERPIREAASLMLAARVESKMNHHKQAVAFASKAVEGASWLAAAHLELARCYLAAGDHVAAFQSVDAAFYRHPPSLVKVNRDPAFRQAGEPFRQFKQDLRQRVAANVARVLRSEVNIASADLPGGPVEQVTASNALASLDQASILKIVRVGRLSADHTLTRLQRAAEGVMTSWRAAGQWSTEVERMRKEAETNGTVSPNAPVQTPPAKRRGDPVADAVNRLGLHFAILFVLLGLLGLGVAVIINVEFIVFKIFAGYGMLLVGVRCAHGLGMIRKAMREIAVLNKDAARTEELQRKAELDEADRRKAAAAASARLRSELGEKIQNVEQAELSARAQTIAHCRLLCGLIVEFEATAARFSYLSPVVGFKSSRPGDIVRIDPDDANRLKTIDSVDQSLLPPSLAEFTVQPGAAEGKYRFVRVAEAAGKRSLIRWACYFPLDARSVS